MSKLYVVILLCCITLISGVNAVVIAPINYGQYNQETYTDISPESVSVDGINPSLFGSNEGIILSKYRSNRGNFISVYYPNKDFIIRKGWVLEQEVHRPWDFYSDKCSIGSIVIYEDKISLGWGYETVTFTGMKYSDRVVNQ